MKSLCLLLVWLLSLNRLVSYAQITLPLEVVGPDGYTKSVSFLLNDASGVNTLYLKAHRLAYRDASTNPDRGAKGSVKLNDGPWVDLDNSTVNCHDHEAAYGCLSGAYHTVRLTVPISGAKTGQNTLTFRFNGTDGFSSGYRVLAFNLRKDSKGSNQLPDATFSPDDPTTWTPPRPRSSDIQAGKVLWQEAQLKDYPGGPTIQATCAGCHARDGRDLEYFAFSNWSIQERAKFHGLNQQEAEQIASYIRNLRTEKGVQPHGRPWNPPYQPGPGLDSRPVEEWAAGAGLDGVLEEDKEMLPYLFAEGTSEGAINKTSANRRTLNAREMPIALQLPDWLAWLPEEHPVDVWGTAFWDTDPYKVYQETLTKLADGGAAEMRTDPEMISSQALLKGTLDPLRRTVDAFTQQGGAQPCQNSSVHSSNAFSLLGRAGEPPSSDKWNDPDVCERPLRSINHWNATKHWEVMQEFDLEEATADVYPYGEARGWAGSYRQVFELAPHRIGNDSYSFAHLGRGQGSYFNTAWYQLQVILNAGNRNPRNHRPPDWKYQMNHLYHAADDNDHPQPLRYVQTLIKMQQNLDMRQPDDFPVSEAHFPYREDRGPTSEGWWLTHVTPWRFVSVGESVFTNSSQRFGIWDQLEAVEPGLKNKVQNALLEHWLDKTETYDTEEWPRGEGQENVNPMDYVPTAYPGGGVISSSGTHADGIYRTIPLMHESGINPGLIERLRLWGKAMWPKGDWEALKVMPPAEDWTQELLFDDQLSNFTVAFSVLPSCADTDGVIGLSAATVPTDYSNLAVAVWFNNKGQVVARNGDAFQASQEFKYAVGRTYQVQLDVYFSTKRYDVKIKEQKAADWAVLATGYAFNSNYTREESLSRLYKKTQICGLMVNQAQVDGESTILSATELLTEKVMVYPNPSTGVVHLVGVKGKVEMYNSLGYKIDETWVQGNQATLDLSGQSGIVFIRAENISTKVLIR